MVDELPDRGEELEQTAQTQSESEDDDLALSLSALSQLSAARLSLRDLLTEVATFAVQAIPGADGAGLTLIEAGRADTIVKSAPFVREIDGIQYGLGEGPCISAAAQGKPMRSGSLGGDSRWPRFGPQAGRLGVHSVLSLPLISAGQVVGAMNVYAHAKDAFDERSEHLGRAVCGARGDRGAERADPRANPTAGGEIPVSDDQPRGDRSGHRHPDEPQRDHPGRGPGQDSPAQPAREHQDGGCFRRHCHGGRPPGPRPPHRGTLTFRTHFGSRSDSCA